MESMAELCPLSEGVGNKWHVAYTMPKSEKKAYLKLTQLGVGAFLPLQKVVRIWSDRKKKLEVPLFPNYIFINTTDAKRFEVLKLKEIIRYVSFCGVPAIIPDSLIDSLKKITLGEFEVSNSSWSEGMSIKILDGPFMGVEGILLKRQGSKRLLVKIEALQRAVSIDIASNAIVPV